MLRRAANVRHEKIESSLYGVGCVFLLLPPLVGLGSLGFPGLILGLIVGAGIGFAGAAYLPLLPARYELMIGKAPAHRLSEQAYSQLLENQQNEPSKIWSADAKTWWMFKDNFYWEDQGLTALEVKALALNSLRTKEKRIERAIALMEHEDNGDLIERVPIPDEVKTFVWNRDGGKCAKCAGRVNLEFDHIIPVSKGGSNTARNIELLCEACNRSKGASIV